MNTYPKMFCSNIEKYYKNNVYIFLSSNIIAVNTLYSEGTENYCLTIYCINSRHILLLWLYDRFRLEKL